MLKSLSRAVVNLLLDTLLLILFLALVWVSAVLRFVFPDATSASHWTLWGNDFNAWSQLQFNLIALLALGILVHVMLHWSWVCGTIVYQFRGATKGGANAKLDDGTRTLYGVATLVVIFNIVGGLLAFAALSIQAPNVP